MSSVLGQTNAKQLKNIKRELNEDDKKLKHYVKLFYDWLKCEEHLPINVDQRLVENYIRLCKHDLQKAKDKFEKFIISTSKYSKFYDHGHLNPDFFSPYKFHRMFHTLPSLTPDGYRIQVLHVEDTDITYFSIENLLKYIYVTGNYMFHHDLNAGIIIIIDFRNAGANLLQKINIMALKQGLEVGVKIMPSRIKSLHAVHLPTYCEVLFKLATSLMKEKLKDRIVLHKTVDGLLDYFDRDLLPKDLGGTLKSLNEIGDDWKEHLMDSQKWLKKTEDLKLMGPVPKNKQNGLNDDNVGGSFRQLSID